MSASRPARLPASPTLPGASALRRLPIAAALAVVFAAPGAFAAPAARDDAVATGADTTTLALAGAPATAGTMALSTLEAVEVTGEKLSPYRAREVAAAKVDVPLRNLPQSVSVITDELIRDQAMQSMADVVRYVPGVQMAQGEGHRDAPILRGNTSTADFFVDGLRDDVQYFRDLYNVERVEVLKGPGGMLAGRGASGGLINRVTKSADWTTVRGLHLGVGEHDAVRMTGDFGQPISDTAAFRVTGMVEDSGSFRDHVELERFGINPTLAFRLGDATTIELGVEHFEDDRTVDRGVPSNPATGRPLDVDRSTFFGSPGLSYAEADVDAFTARIALDVSDTVRLLNHTRIAAYDKFYQNVLPGAYDPATQRVAVSGYSNLTERENVLNQTDLTFGLATGAVSHDLLVGLELGRQSTDNYRQTGYFTDVSPTATSDWVTLDDTTYDGTVEFRQSASDADNHGVARTAALYLQDRIEFSPQWEALLGVRYDRFDLELDNRRDGSTVSSTDGLWSPRVGVVFKPRGDLSLYGGWTVSHQPRAGEQLASLTPSNRTLAPEKFTNAEVGVKWDLADEFAFTAALFRLDRTNVAIVDPANPAQSLLVDGQRVTGLELGLSGQLTDAWQVMAGYAWQDSEVQLPGAQDGNALGQVPEHSASLWNRVDFSPRWGAGVGVVYRDDVYVSTDNAVVLPSFTRVDAAVYWTVSDTLRLQANVENLFDTGYHASAHSNNNLLPGAPRTLRLGVDFRF